jgi:NagD protein
MHAPDQRTRAIDGIVFDLDGTLVLGDRNNNGYELLPGSREVLAAARARGLPLVALTNGTVHIPEEYAANLRAAGLAFDGHEVMTPASVAADYLSRHGYKRVLVLGVSGVWRPLEVAGIEVILPLAPETGADAVLIGWHPDFNLRDLEAACKAVWAGARVFTTSNARFFATRDGPALGVSGAIATMIASVTGKRAVVLGKPSQHALACASRRLGVPIDRLAVVGDDPTLEVAMARKGGAYAVAVLTGLATEKSLAELPSGRRPHLVVRSVRDLLSSEVLARRVAS